MLPRTSILHFSVRLAIFLAASPGWTEPAGSGEPPALVSAAMIPLTRSDTGAEAPLNLVLRREGASREDPPDLKLSSIVYETGVMGDPLVWLACEGRADRGEGGAAVALFAADKTLVAAGFMSLHAGGGERVEGRFRLPLKPLGAAALFEAAVPPAFASVTLGFVAGEDTSPGELRAIAAHNREHPEIRVHRSGSDLVLGLETGGASSERILRSYAVGDSVRVFRFKRLLKEIPWFLVFVGYWENHRYLLINRRDGAEIAIDGPPVFSPAGERFAVSAYCPPNGESNNSLSIWKLECRRPVEEWGAVPSGWGVREAVWLGPEVLEARGAIFTPDGEEKPLKFEIRPEGGKWKCPFPEDWRAERDHPLPPGAGEWRPEPGKDLPED